MTRDNFKLQLAKLMGIRKLDVVSLSNKSGIHHVILRRYLKGDPKGKLPGLPNLIALATALNCTLEELTGVETLKELDESVGKFANNLTRIMSERNISQAELAELTGLEPSHISKLTRGERAPRYDTLIALVKALKCTFEELTGVTEFREIDKQTPEQREQTLEIADLYDRLPPAEREIIKKMLEKLSESD